MESRNLNWHVSRRRKKIAWNYIKKEKNARYKPKMSWYAQNCNKMRQVSIAYPLPPLRHPLCDRCHVTTVTYTRAITAAAAGGSSSSSAYVICHFLARVRLRKMTQSFLFFLSFRTKPRFCRDSKSDAELSLFSIFLSYAYACVKWRRAFSFFYLSEPNLDFVETQKVTQSFLFFLSFSRTRTLA